MLGLFNEFNLKLRNPNNGKIEAALYYNILQYQPRILQANIQNKMKTKESKIQNKDENKPSSFEKTRSLSPKSLGQLLTKDTSFQQSQKQSLFIPTNQVGPQVLPSSPISSPNELFCEFPFLPLLL